MDRRQLLLGMTVLAVRSFTRDCLAIPLSAETDNQQSPTKNAHLSDREQAGLRGPVRFCVEEQESGALTTEYDVDGRMIATMRGSQQVSTRKYDNHGYLLEETEGKEGATYSYDDEGKLLHVASHNESSSKVYNYSYDDNARLTSIANATDASDRVDLVYDSQGGRTLTAKTRIEKFPGSAKIPPDTIPGVASVRQLSFFLLQGLLNGDGSSKAVWNDHDQPTELQSYDARGQLVNRLILTYDSNGNMIEGKLVVENCCRCGPKPWVDALSRSSTYTYDSEGHVTEERNMMGKRIDSHVVRSYNDHGDLASESTMRIYGNIVIDTNRFNYQYDSYGNWTQKTENTAFVSSDETHNSEAVTQRKLSYW